MAGAGRMAGAMGMASVMRDVYVHSERAPKSLDQLKDEYLVWLESKNRRGWKWALKDMFHLKDELKGDAEFVRVMGGLFNSDELSRLHASWWEDDHVTVRRSVIEEDIESLQKKEDGHIGYTNKGGRLDPKISAGSKSKSNVESADSSIRCDAEQPWAAEAGVPETASTSRPQRSDRPAGVAQVTGGTINNGSSVPGGIFSEEFTMAKPPPPDPLGGNKSNLPSIKGGIFEDHSGGVPQPSGKPSRSQKSSVPGGIFAPSLRPATVEYGYEPFSRQGLEYYGKAAGTAG